MKNCPYCGAMLDDNATFCAACGTAFAPAASAPAFDGSASTGNVVKKLVIAAIAVVVVIALFLVLFLGISGTGFVGLGNAGIQSAVSNLNKAIKDQDGEKFAGLFYPDEAYDFYTDEKEKDFEDDRSDYSYYDDDDDDKGYYETYFDCSNEKEKTIDAFEEAFDDDPMDNYTDEQLDKMDSEQRDRLDAQVLLSDATASIKIRKIEKVSDSKLKDAKKYFKKYYGIEITALKKVKIEMTYKGLSKADEEQIKDAGLAVVGRETIYAYKYNGKWYLPNETYFDD